MMSTKRTVVDEGGDDLRFGPLSFRIELFRESVPTAVVCDRNLCEVVLQNGLMEVDDKLREGRGSTSWRRVIPFVNLGRYTHSLDRIRNLRKRCLLRHLMLHGDKGGFIDSWLGCNAKEGSRLARQKNKIKFEGIYAPSSYEPFWP